MGLIYLNNGLFKYFFLLQSISWNKIKKILFPKSTQFYCPLRVYFSLQKYWYISFLVKVASVFTVTVYNGVIIKAPQEPGLIQICKTRQLNKAANFQIKSNLLTASVKSLNSLSPMWRGGSSAKIYHGMDSSFFLHKLQPWVVLLSTGFEASCDLRDAS